MRMFAKNPSPPRRGMLLTLDAIVVFLFLLSIMQPFLLQTAMMRIHAYERSMDDARVSLLMQLSQQLYTRALAPHPQSGQIIEPQNYTQVGYYDDNQNHDQTGAALAELNLSTTVLDSPPSSGLPPIPSSSSQSAPPSSNRICLSRLMATGSGAVHEFWICDS